MTAAHGDELTELVLAVEGVADAFPPPSLPQLLVAAAVGAEDVRAELAPSHDGLRIEARIATRRSAHSADTAREVADALVRRFPDPEAQIHVQIARIS
ncbi:hypothetical protein [Microbacterium sp. P05]|uniref:hypothetical protein n=1 Tax=Microbacterium sp. P05 TaxID=3366948 RepID=UPI0037462A34